MSKNCRPVYFDKGDTLINKLKRESLDYCSIMNIEPTESVIATLGSFDEPEDDIVHPPTHPPATTFLLAAPAGGKTKQKPAPTSLLPSGYSRGQNNSQNKRYQGAKGRGSWGDSSSSSPAPRKERLTSVLCSAESAGWYRTVHHKLINLGLAIAEKTTFEEILGSSRTTSFPENHKVKEFFQTQFGLKEPLMDQFWSRYTLESQGDMAKLFQLQKSVEAHAEEAKLLAIETRRYRQERDDFRGDARRYREERNKAQDDQDDRDAPTASGREGEGERDIRYSLIRRY